MSFKGILLDIDHTIYDYDTTHSIALNSVFDHIQKKHGITTEAIEKAYTQARKSVHIELAETASSHNRLLYFQRLYEYLGINPLLTAFETYDIYWNTFLDNLAIREGVYDFLESIRDKKICLVTDLTAHIQYRKIEKLQLYHYADAVVTSEEVGREKPHPYMFMLALNKLQLKPEEVCMIGDSYKKDIIGASRLGIRSFWLNDKDQREDNDPLIHPFKTFNELAGIIQ